MVDAVVGIFLEKLADALIAKGRIVIEFEDQFAEMKRQLKLMQAFLKDADKIRRKDSTLRAVIDNLTELIYDAEDILAKCQTRTVKKADGPSSFLKFPFRKKVAFNFQTGKSLRDINKKIKDIKEDIASYVSPALSIHKDVDELESNVKRWSSPIFDRKQIVGLDDATYKIKQWLFHTRDDLNAVGIVGMGGLGKTTTAQNVFCDKEIEDYFEKRIWVSVSQTFKEEEIMRNLLKNLGEAGIGDDEGELLQKIHNYLLGKSYLIVLDDVWSLHNGWWSRLLDGLPKGNRTSIIITTRIEGVALGMGADRTRLHRPKLLTKEESWSLFCRVAFPRSGNRCPDSKLSEVGMEIVDKCDGLPLAIKAVGGMMFCKPFSFVEWRRIANNFRDELAENTGTVMVSLQLSYDELPAHLKPCFLCFSLYPEDCIVSKDQLIHWWIGEGFVPAKKGRSLVESAEDCFTGLVNRCLIEVVDESYSGKVHTCKMHDMVRDLVVKISGEEAFCKLGNGYFRRLSLPIDNEHFKSTSKLRALVSTTNSQKINTIGPEFAKVFSCENLRVLDLSESILEKHSKNLLSQIGSLQHLIYLCLRNTHPMNQIPQTVVNLTNLHILDISFCHSLKFLPTYLIKMTNLTILDMSCCGSLVHFPKGFGKLINLQVLKGFKPSRATFSDGCRIGELKNLCKLKTLELLITRSDEIADDELGVLSYLLELQELSVSCFDCNDSNLAIKLDRLHLPQQLHELSLKFFPGKLTPSWLNPVLLPELHYLHLSSGNFNHFNPTFWSTDCHVWRLHGLMLEALADLEEEWMMVNQSLPSLKILNVSWCPNLKSFPISDVGFKGGVWLKE